MNNKHIVIIWLLLICYIVYFGWFSILRYRHLYAEYFDLGIMQQTVYNTFYALKTADMSSFLELTSPHGYEQIKRMAIHNDIILALLAPFYFIYSGPETLLVLQTLVLALGAVAVYKIAQILIKNNLISLLFAWAYLMYSPMQRANIFEFHAVTFATTLILCMFYFYLKKRLWLSFLFLVLAMITKEQVGLSLGMFSFYQLYLSIKKKDLGENKKFFYFFTALLSIAWSIVSVFLIIPYFRGDSHFGSVYYENSLVDFFNLIFRSDTFGYFVSILGPLGFLTILAPEFLFIALPELGINLLSKNLQLRNLDFQYISVIQPWIFIGAIYGVKKIMNLNIKNIHIYLSWIITASTLLFSYLHSPLPYAQRRNIDPWLYDRKSEYDFVKKWSERLDSYDIKVSATDQIAPLFTSRRYFYIFSENYKYADYVIISKSNLMFTYRKEATIPAYKKLKDDPLFEKIEEGNGYEVYKKIKRVLTFSQVQIIIRKT